MVVDFLYTTVGLEAKFTNLSTEVPDGNTYLWDFGDKTPTSSDPNPSHKYEASGFFKVTLTVLYPESLPVEGGKVEYLIAITDKAKTHLSRSIYQLIDIYIPKDIFGDIGTNIKRQFINKWQLYLQPLVNHEVPLEEYSNELYYEALENQLILELVSYDYIIDYINSYVFSINSTIGLNEDDNGKVVKRMTTGPSEVEWFDNSDTNNEKLKTIAKYTQNNGYLDLLKNNICNLADRLDIPLTLCKYKNHRILPIVVKNTKDRPFEGPNPTTGLN